MATPDLSRLTRISQDFSVLAARERGDAPRLYGQAALERRRYGGQPLDRRLNADAALFVVCGEGREGVVGKRCFADESDGDAANQ